MGSDERNKMREILRAPYAGIGATELALEEVMSELGCRLPLDYLDLMRDTNGYNGEVGVSGYVSIWPVAEIVPTNTANKVRECVPGLILFGSNEGDEYFAFDLRQDPIGVAMVPMVPLELKSAILVGKSFTDFLERLAKK